MEFDAVLIEGRRAYMQQHGYWHNFTILDALKQAVAQQPNKTALVSYKQQQPTQSFTYTEIWQLTNQMALGLKRLGIQAHDVVACQLPNWWEFTLLYLACSRIGAVLNPLMPIFRERELEFMLKHGEAKLFVVPKIFRGFDHAALATQLQSKIPTLEQVLVIDEQQGSFQQLLGHELSEEEIAALDQYVLDPDQVTQLIFTSGTTGEPKGVMHTSNTLFANIVEYANTLHLDQNDVVLMASPMAHQTGFMYGLMMPIWLQAKAVLQDIWDVNQAIEVIQNEQVSFTMASTPFLNDLSSQVAQFNTQIPSLKTFLCAGAPIPGPLVEQARQNLNIKVISAWGMTECGAVTMTLIEDPDERSCHTDGKALKGVEIKIVDKHGQEKPVNSAGRLWVRSCSNFAGYLKRPHLNDTNSEDWFDTGDIAYQDEHGYIRICGRKKDVIIRGGENIPVAEIESLLYQHPKIATVALVAYPDERLGERACAIVKLKDSAQALELGEILTFLQQHNLAKQYLPERLEVWDNIPMTPSGKIQKFKLREMLVS